MCGASDLAFPRLNLLSWYIYVVGGTFILLAILFGGVDTGWTFYTPYSSVYSSSQVALTITGVFFAGFASIFTGINFIVTIHKMRAPGLTWFRMPLFLWAMYAVSIVMVLGTPVVAITLSLVVVERVLGIGIFNPALGGDPILFQHMFWFYSHPAVYIMILPSFGIISEVIACFSRKRIFGYSFVAFSSVAIAAFGFFVWGHHMFTTGQSMYSGMVFSVISFLVAIPSAIKVFNWSTTLYKGPCPTRRPDAVRNRVYRAVYGRRPDRPVPFDNGNGHSPAGDVLCRGAFPLRHGRRRHARLSGGTALLVAENDGPNVSRMGREGFRRAGVHWL